MTDDNNLMLIDKWERFVPFKPGVEKYVRSVTPIARRFVFDAEACAHVGRLLFEAADLVAEQIMFAKPPYDHTYIELSDARAMFQAWRPIEPNPQQTSDSKIGLLYSNDKLYNFCYSDTSTMPATLSMFCTRMGHGQTTPLKEVFGTSTGKVVFHNVDNWQEYVKLAYLLGGMRQPEGFILMPRADYEYFLDNYDLSILLAPVEKPEHVQHRFDTMVDSAFFGGGDLLIGAACLFLIHGDKKGINIQSVPHSRGWFKGKRIVYHKHGVVTIKLSPRESLRKLVFGTRESPRRHDVMGTWVHYHRDRHCEHEWRRLEDQLDDHERYQCKKCPTLRTWRAAHVRGEGAKGIKTKTYSVTE